MSQLTPNHLSKDVEIKGTITFDSNLFIDGRLEGEILSSGTLTIGENGSVKGDIQAAAVSIHGVVNGNVTVEQRCELKTDAELVGDLKAPRLIIEEGATFVGRSEVTPKTASIKEGSGKPAAIPASAPARA